MSRICGKLRREWPGVAGILAAAFLLSTSEMLLLPLSELLAPPPPPLLELRSVNTIDWQHEHATPPELPHKPLPLTNVASPEPIDIQQQPQTTTHTSQSIPQKHSPRPQIRLDPLPVFDAFSPAPDLSLNFPVDNPPSSVVSDGTTANDPHTPGGTPPGGAPPGDALYDSVTWDAAPMPISQPPPIYPYRAKLRGIQGRVEVVFTVRLDGTTADAAALSGEPAGVFEAAALRAVHTWHFKPAEKGGRPVPARMKINIRFDLLE